MQTSKEVMKRLESEGWERTNGKGDHKKFRHPDFDGHVIVPHPRKNLLIGRLRVIYKQANWPWPP